MNDLLNTIIAAALPTVLDLSSLAIMGILLWVSNVARQRWGIEIEARHREALHAALMSGIEAALMRGLGAEDAIADAIRHAQESVPDAIAALKPQPEVLKRIAEAKMRSAKQILELWSEHAPEAA